MVSLNPREAVSYVLLKTAGLKKLSIFGTRFVSCIPEEIVSTPTDESTSEIGSGLEKYLRNKVGFPENSSINDRTRWIFSSPICTKMEPEFGQQVPGHGEAVPQVGLR